MLTSGQLLAERYRLGRRIAVGGMGEVWEAEDARLDRKVAVKVLKPELCGDAEFLHRFRIEARTTASLNHPGVAAVHDYGETAAVPGGPEDTAYLVMELVEGEPLAGILARERVLTPERTLDVLEQAGHALQAAHERALVHRDVKPGNILVTPSGQVKITDFGIAKAADAAPVTRSGMVMGTAHYIAPEQAVGQEAEPASDVYSLAVVGYECLVGHRPFLSENAVTVAMMHIRGTPPPLPPQVPPGLRALIEATLVKDPRRRYQTGGEFAGAVAAVRAGHPLPTPSSLLTGANLAATNLGNLGPHTGVNIPVMPPHPAVPQLPPQIPQQSAQPVPQQPMPPQPVAQPQVPQQQIPQAPQQVPAQGTQPGLHPVPQVATQGTQPGVHPVPPQGMNPGPTVFGYPVPRRLPVRKSRAGWWALGAVVVTAAVVVLLLAVAIHAGYLGRPAGQPDAIRPVGVGSVAMSGRPGNTQRWIRDGITGGAATWIEQPGVAWQVPRPTPARYAGHPTGMTSSTQTRSGTTQR